MQTENEIQTELKELHSRLAGLPKLQPYALPAPGYLDELPALLAAGTRMANAADPQPDWGLAPAFEVPEGYFDHLAQTLTGTAAGSTALPTSLPYALPEGYMDQLPQQLLAGVKAAGSTKPRTVPFRPIIRRVAPWLAAAAVMAGVWFGIGRGPAAEPPEAEAVSALVVLDRDSIGAYVEQHAEDFDPEVLEAALAGGFDADLRDAVSELPESEIEAYLNDAAPERSASDGS